jgi:membrane protease YdiL (CAAX protease family)
MEALLLKIRNDLRSHRQTLAAQQNKEWRNILILNIALPLGLLLIYPFIKNWQSHNLLLIYYFSPVLYLQSLKKFFVGLPQKNILYLAFILVLSALSTFTWFTNPDLQPTIFSYSGWSALLAIFLVWIVLAWIFEKNLPRSRRYSLTPFHPFLHIASGAFMGAGLAFHGLLVSRFLPIINLPLPGLNAEKLVWLFGLFAGLIIPAEELFFRGKLFSLLFDEKSIPLKKTILWISALNLVVYLPALLYLSKSPNTLPFGVIALFYKFILSVVSVFIIYRWRNLYVVFAANLAFSMVIIQPFYL